MAAGKNLGNVRSVLRRAIAVLAVAISSMAPAAANEDRLWRAVLSGEAFAMMRHAIAPGTGDPSGFKIGDCSTQRNLSDRGREQARRAGRLFRKNGITDASVYTSQWCRCRETARLLAVGEVTDLESLNSFFQDYARREPQTRALKEWLAARKSGKPLVLVTHQVNISALTGSGVGSGEIVFVARRGTGAYEVLGTVTP